MVKYYPGVLLQPASITSEMKCQYDSSILASTAFVPPMGYCELLSDGIHAYCTQPLLCAGHCTSYSTYDNNTGTFAPGALECYNGYAAPTCLTTCLRTDASGLCLPDLQTTATGVVPYGTMCNLLKYYQCSVNYATNIMTCYRRQWYLESTSIVPNGQISQIIGAGGGCPATAWAPYTNGQADLVLTAINQATAYIVVTYAPELYYNGSISCDPACCNIVGLSISVDPSTPYNLQVPQCGAMQVNIYENNNPPLTNDLTPCGQYNAASIASAIQSASSNIPLGIQTTLVTVQNNIVTGLAQSLLDIYQNLANLVVMATTTGATSEQIIASVIANTAGIQNALYLATANDTIPLSPRIIAPFNFTEYNTRTGYYLSTNHQQCHSSK